MTIRRLVTTLSVFAGTCLSAGCGDAVAPTFTVVPTIAGNPNPAVPLAAIVSADTDEPSVLLIQISDEDRRWGVPTSDEPAIRHSLAVLGFRPGRRHVVQVSARDEAGNISTVVPLEFETAPLPADFPSLEVSVSSPEKMEPGVTLFALMRWPEEGDTDEEFGLAVAVDEQGEVVWYRRSD